jgi:hypothetical protein
MIQELLAQGLTKEEIIAIYVEQLGFTQGEAEMVFAIETGEIDGDLVAVEGPDERQP